MTELITLIIMLALALVSGVCTVVLINKKSPIKGWMKKFVLLCTISFFQLFVWNLFRYALFISDEIYPYSENLFLLFYDLVLLIVGMLGGMYFYEKVLQGRNRGMWSIQNIYVFGILMCFVVEFIYFYNRYHHIKSTVYKIFTSKNIIVVGIFSIVLCLVCEVLYRFIKRQLSFKTLEKGVIRNKLAITQPIVWLYIITLWGYPVLETYLVNSGEFDFTIDKIWYLYLGAILVVYIIVSMVFFFLKGKILEIMLAGTWSLSICAYIQAMFMNNKLFLMDGNEGGWTYSLRLINILVWLMIFFILFVISYNLKDKVQGLVKIVSLGLCAMQLIGGISLIPAYSDSENVAQSRSDYLSTEGLHEVAREGNVIVFVLDTYDIDYINEVLEQKPDFLEPLKGFTYFPDTVSQFSRTFPSIIYMLTNKQYFYEYPQSEYKELAYEECDFWKNMIDGDYKCYFYEEDTDYIGKSVRVNAKNYVENGTVIKENASFLGCVEAIYRINSYRMLPYSLKNYYKYTSSSINDLVISEKIWDKTKFEADDAQIYQELQKFGLQISEDDYAFRFIHLKGAHAPYTMNEKGKRVEEGAHVRIPQYIGSMNYVFDYLEKLQELDLYEQATIVITADHGENFVATELGQNTNPILFIKPANVGADNELEISDVYASQNDVIPTIAADINIALEEGWGMDLFSTEGKDKERTRYHYYAVVENTYQVRTKTYQVVGSSLDFGNWIPTEEYHEFGIYY